MKILQIDVNYKKSSTGKIVHLLHTYLIESGFDSYVLYGRGSKSDDANVFKFGIDIETYFHALMTRITGLTGFYSYFSTKRLINKIKKIKPDVIQIHELHAYFVNYGMLMRYIQKKNIRIYWTFHCEFMYTGKCGHSHDCNKWKTTCNKCPLKKDYPKSLLFDFTTFMHNHKKKIFKKFDDIVIITPSIWIENRVKESFLGRFKTEVIHNGIDLNKYPNRERSNTDFRHRFGIPNEALVILTLGPNILSVSKGGNNLIDISKIINKKNIHYIIVGAEFTKTIDNIHIVEKTSNMEVISAYYSIADLFFIGSKRENFPTTALEALSHGVPVIGYDSGGTKETAPAPYGVFFDYLNNQSVSNFIVAYLSDKSLLADRKDCRVFAEQNFNNIVMARKYKELYIRGVQE